MALLPVALDMVLASFKVDTRPALSLTSSFWLCQIHSELVSGLELVLPVI